MDIERKPNEKYNEHYVSIRVHKEYVKEEDLIKYLHQYDKPFMVLETHGSEREHYQSLFIKKSVRGSLPKTIRDNICRDIKKKLNLKGNKQFAVSYIYETPDKFLRYLCKGSKETLPDIKINNILLESQIAPYHHKYWEENKNYKTTDSHRKYAKIMAIKLPEKYEKYENHGIGIGMKIIKYHDENNLLIPDDYQLKKMIRTYSFKTLDEKLKWNRAFSIVENILET